jgi:L-rhamnose mutarotase
MLDGLRSRADFALVEGRILHDYPACKRGQRMGQHAWVLEVRPGYEEEYKKRHDEIWPEMVDALRKAGVRNYSIFRHGLTLFGYFETDDLIKTIDAIAKDPVNARWNQSMAPLMKIEVDQRTGFPFLLPKQWHID